MSHDVIFFGTKYRGFFISARHDKHSSHATFPAPVPSETRLSPTPALKLSSVQGGPLTSAHLTNRTRTPCSPLDLAARRFLLLLLLLLLPGASRAAERRGHLARASSRARSHAPTGQEQEGGGRCGLLVAGNPPLSPVGGASTARTYDGVRLVYFLALLSISMALTPIRSVSLHASK